MGVEQVGSSHRLVAVGVGPADPDSSTEEVALGAALLIEVAGRPRSGRDDVHSVRADLLND